jgi:hypothetical protein
MWSQVTEKVTIFPEVLSKQTMFCLYLKYYLGETKRDGQTDGHMAILHTWILSYYEV